VEQSEQTSDVGTIWFMSWQAVQVLAVIMMLTSALKGLTPHRYTSMSAAVAKV
jgi:hypothetical protein